MEVTAYIFPSLQKRARWENKKLKINETQRPPDLGTKVKMLGKLLAHHFAQEMLLLNLLRPVNQSYTVIRTN